MLNANLYGCGELPLVSYQGHRLEPETAKQLAAMQHGAAKDGIAIGICSSYRDFTRQLAIWNNKATGSRPVLDAQCQPVDIAKLSSDELLDTILLWSALPGMSRHHWGTDIDLFDANQVTRQDLQLVSQEYSESGPCHQLRRWLIQFGKDFGFYFPYQAGLSGVSPEPWHLSYYPKAEQYLAHFDVEQLSQIIEQQPIYLKEAIQARLTTLVKQYVYFVAPPPGNEPSTHNKA